MTALARLDVLRLLVSRIYGIQPWTSRLQQKNALRTVLGI